MKNKTAVRISEFHFVRKFKLILLEQQLKTYAMCMIIFDFILEISSYDTVDFARMSDCLSDCLSVGLSVCHSILFALLYSELL